MADEKTVSHGRAREVLRRLGEATTPGLLIESATLHLYISQRETIDTRCAPGRCDYEEQIAVVSQSLKQMDGLHDTCRAQLTEAVWLLREALELAVTIDRYERVEALLARVDSANGGT